MVSGRVGQQEMMGSVAKNHHVFQWILIFRSQDILRRDKGCPLSQVLFLVLMDGIFRCSQAPEGVQFGSNRLPALLLTADVVVLASSQDLQHVLGRVVERTST